MSQSKLKAIFWGILGVLLLFTIAIWWQILLLEQEGYYFVQQVVDGDTLRLSNGERIRLIGVDTPEVYESNKLYRDVKRTKRDIETIKYLGRRSSAFTRRLVEKKKVRLEFDPGNIYLHHRDKYGRLLAYVYLTDGTFLNAEIIKQGYGYAYTRFPFRFMEDFRRYEDEAWEEQRGLWAEE